MNVLLLSVLLLSTLNLVMTVPYGFVGVRGKKSQTDSLEPSIYNEDFQKSYNIDDDKLINYLLKQDARQNYPVLQPWEDLYYYEKRVPQGFTAVRGKRNTIKQNR
ncbi:unnamed protein product [Psylliodes chrysocephalus]|uniref:Uncharacterized protein n=1 Tax=Psylliodes chrysocephalus TaxID=3402493 RepID=A0A9P0CWR1_9CUCU|nr:unnamed protein product [Psylliodes chrysocephala]